MSIVTIALDKEPELAALVADKQPGDWITLRASIKAKDDQTLAIRIEDCDDAEKPESDEEDDGVQTDDTDGERPPPSKSEPQAEKPGKSLARKLESSYGM